MAHEALYNVSTTDGKRKRNFLELFYFYVILVFYILGALLIKEIVAYLPSHI